MNRDTAALIQALGSVNQNIPRMANDVLLGQMPPAKQHEFADLLIELGELLHRSAEAEETASPDAHSGSDDSQLANPPRLTDSEEQQL